MDNSAFVLACGQFFGQHVRNTNRSRCRQPEGLYCFLTAQKHLTSSIYCCIGADSDSNGQSKLEPVEDGVKLPKFNSRESLEEEVEWLEDRIREWLDQEWKQEKPQPIHAKIGMRAAQIYSRQRMEGEDDLSSVLIAIGSELEGMDFSDAFVGPWNVANKTAEFLLEHRAGPRVRLKPYVRDPNAPTWSKEMAKRQKASKRDARKGRRTPPAPSLADYFEKLKFLRDILDKEVTKEVSQLRSGLEAYNWEFLFSSDS